MKIQIDGTNCTNKGAELILYAVLQQIEERHPNANIIFNGSTDGQDLNDIRTSLNISQPICESSIVKKLKIQRLLSRMHLPHAWCTQMAPNKDVDVIFDASGFRFTDQWKLSDERTDLFVNYYKNQHKYGSKIIFLPQAWGPIELPNTKRLVNIINETSDIICAREQVSYDYLKNSGCDISKIRLYPDFTCLVKPVMPQNYLHLKGAVCIIPNARMLDMASLGLEYYVNFYSKIISHCVSFNKNVFILNHSGTNDEKICRILSTRLGVEYVSKLNALETKGLISQCYLVISSRFHGVANALNSAIPCLATSWSHKYKLIFEDYNQCDCLLNVDDISESLNKVTEFCDPATHEKIRQQLMETKMQVCERVSDMWNKIWEVI